MERTGTADDQEAVRLAHDDIDGIFAALEDGLMGGTGDGDFGDEQVRCNKRILTKDCFDRLVLFCYAFGETAGGVEGHSLRVLSMRSGLSRVAMVAENKSINKG